MNRRLPNSRPTPSLTRGAETPETPCHAAYRAYEADVAENGRREPWVFDALLDVKGRFELAVVKRQADEMCGACPIRDACHTENADKEWLEVLNAQTTRPCDHCGDEMSVVKKGPRRQYCSAGCGIAARKARGAVA